MIIWGVDCRQDAQGADVAKAKFPVEDAAQFRSLLEGRISGLTLPVHGAVVNHTIVGNHVSGGFAATLIPEADNMPLQLSGKYNFYMRAGSHFVPVMHQV